MSGPRKQEKPEPANRGAVALDKDKLIALRKERVMSREELADAAGLSPETIASYEMGRRRPRPMQLRSLALGLGVNPAQLLL